MRVPKDQEPAVPYYHDQPVVTPPPSRKLVISFPFEVKLLSDHAVEVNLSEQGHLAVPGLGTIHDLDQWGLSHDAEHRVHEAAQQAILNAFLKEVIRIDWQR